jgi:ribose 5-phosphate isomerase RpiB
VTGTEVAKEIVDVFLSEPFSTGPQHHRRVEKIHQVESQTVITNNDSFKTNPDQK